MLNNLYPYLWPVLIATLAACILFPLLMRWSGRAGLLDIPDHRKVHRKATPVIGGICIALSLILTSLINPQLRQLLLEHKALAAGMLILFITGMQDDRRNLSPSLRLFIQLGCATMVAWQGIRIPSLYGFLGIVAIPVWLQYGLTILVITGLTNAFNLIDGIDGLSGGMALANCIMLGLVAFVTGQYSWLYLVLPFIAALLVFLRFNWYPARLFMGDGGTLFIGFFMSVLSVFLLRTAYEAPLAGGVNPAIIFVSLTACFMIPAVDILRVFTERIRAGKSPFDPDRTHLHHKLVRSYLVHGAAAKRLLLLHGIIILLSIAAIQLISITGVILLQLGSVLLYTGFLNFTRRYIYWLRFIRHMEAAPPETK